MYRSVTGDTGASRTPCGLVAIMSPDKPARAVFELRLVGKPGQAGIHDLRALLKQLVSTSRLSCKRAGKTRTLMPVWDSSGESRLRGKPSAIFSSVQICGVPNVRKNTLIGKSVLIQLTSVGTGDLRPAARNAARCFA